MEMNREYASKGVAGAGLGTGIAGLSLGFLNAMGGLGALGGLWGNRNGSAQNDILTALLTTEMVRGSNWGRNYGSCGGDCDPVTQREMKLQQEIAAKESENALLKANTYNDQKSLELYKYVDGRFREVEAVLAKQAVQNQATADSFQLVQERQDCCCKRLETAIDTEAKERRCADNAIVNYLNQTFYPKSVANVSVETTTTPQSTYNPLPACTCNCGSN